MEQCERCVLQQRVTCRFSSPIKRTAHGIWACIINYFYSAAKTFLFDANLRNHLMEIIRRRLKLKKRPYRHFFYGERPIDWYHFWLLEIFMRHSFLSFALLKIWRVKSWYKERKNFFCGSLTNSQRHWGYPMTINMGACIIICWL